MSDLTDEELIATRKLHRLDDGLYEEKKEENILDIENITLLKEKTVREQAEIEQLKNKNKHQSKEIQKAVDYTFELNKEIEKKDIELIETKEANRQLSIELQKKDKVIDEMAKFIEVFELDEEIVKTYCDGTLENCKHKEDIGTCKSCIKQYFERKSENE